MRRFFGKKQRQYEEEFMTALDGRAGRNDLAPGLQNLYSPNTTAKTHIHDLADVLAEGQFLSGEQMEALRAEQKRGTVDLEKYLQKLGISKADILKAKAQLYGFEFRHITPDEVEKEAFEKLELHCIRSNLVLPIAVKDGVLTLGTSEPSNVFGIDDVKRHVGMPVDVVVCTEEDILAVCDKFDESKLNYDVNEIMGDMGDIELIQDADQVNIEDLEKSAGESPVIKFVNYMLSNALHEGASDIHIEPKEKYTQIRYRVDGVLFDSMQAPAKMHPALVSRLKIMANLDISERRVPQDGKIAVMMGGRGVDLRVSVLPCSHGEKVVIRLLDSKSIMLGLDKSGMEPQVLEAFLEQIKLPHGILLVTGPTGSGKSTTLYSALAQMDSKTLNVSTVEDPVEYNLGFCNQVQVNEKTGLTFATALRSLLRQDPDIMMIGEIRDNETARIAVQAALTGHLVLSTLHTNDAPSSISRLVNIGIEPFLIAASLNAVIAQRLIRKICVHCRESCTAPDNLRKYLDKAGIEPSQIFHGKGCDQCHNSGYAGRAGIFELLIVDDKFRDMINTDATVNNMRKAFLAGGQPNLFEDGLAKVKKGVTTIEEVLRVSEVSGEMGDDIVKAETIAK
jgi:type IV pilus assembly protein PilB